MSDPIENLVMRTQSYLSQERKNTQVDKAVIQKRAFLDSFYSQRFNEKKMMRGGGGVDTASQYNTSGTAETNGFMTPKSYQQRQRSSQYAIGVNTPGAYSTNRPNTRQI